MSMANGSTSGGGHPGSIVSLAKLLAMVYVIEPPSLTVAKHTHCLIFVGVVRLCQKHRFAPRATLFRMVGCLEGVGWSSMFIRELKRDYLVTVTSQKIMDMAEIWQRL